MSPNAGERGGGCGASANEFICKQGAKMKFGDLTLYLTYDSGVLVTKTSAMLCLTSKLRIANCEETWLLIKTSMAAHTRCG